jgi:hypothetical protein
MPCIDRRATLLLLLLMLMLLLHVAGLLQGACWSVI